MRFWLWTLPALALMAANAPAEAQEVNALSMLKECEQQSQLCVGMIAGITDMHYIFRVGRKQSIWCAPKNVTVEQYIRIFIAAGQREPQYLNTNHTAFIVNAFKLAYPCETR